MFAFSLYSSIFCLAFGHTELTRKAQKGSFSQLTAAKLTKENPTGRSPGTTDANQLIAALTGPHCLAISTAAPSTAFTAAQAAAANGAAARAALVTARSTAHVETGAAGNIRLRRRRETVSRWINHGARGREAELAVGKLVLCRDLTLLLDSGIVVGGISGAPVEQGQRLLIHALHPFLLKYPGIHLPLRDVILDKTAVVTSPSLLSPHPPRSGDV